MLKIVKIILILAWFAVFILLSALNLYGFSTLNSFIYWWVFLSWLIFVWQLKITSKGSLLLALIFYILAASIATISPNILAEIIMRISFIGLIVGFIQALIEYKKDIYE